MSLRSITTDLQGLVERTDLSLDDLKTLLKHKLDELDKEVTRESYNVPHEDWGAPGSTNFKPGWGEMGG